MVGQICRKIGGEDQHLIFDGLVKSLESSLSVIPEQAGISCFQLVIDSRLRGSDVVSNFLRTHHFSKEFLGTPTAFSIALPAVFYCSQSKVGVRQPTLARRSLCPIRSIS
jgi:hypothetical protein